MGRLPPWFYFPEAGAGLATARPAPLLVRLNIHLLVQGFLAHPQRAATLIALVPRRSLAANLLGGQRGICKCSTDGRATKRLSEWADFDSANTGTVVVFAPGLSRGNRPGDTERDSSNSDQHLLSAHVSLLRLE
jgi:hypothetical protein